MTLLSFPELVKIPFLLREGTTVNYYAALLPRRGPHIASHTVCPSVCPSRYCLLRTSVTCFRQPCGLAVSFVLFTCQGRIQYGDLSRTSLLNQTFWPTFTTIQTLTTPRLVCGTRLVSVQVNQTPGLYAGPGVYPRPGFYPKFYGISKTVHFRDKVTKEH